MENSLIQYDAAITACRDIFRKKNHDYGTAWRILRPSSLTDQIYIKASRIRTIEEAGTSKVGEGITSEFIGIVNYSVMALIQATLQDDDRYDLPEEEVNAAYETQIELARALFQNKNHDYGEIWRDMRISSYTDLILMKILRIKQIEDLRGQVKISEGVDANYLDIINYAVFALIRLHESIST